MHFRDIENLMTMNKQADKIRMIWTFLKGQTLSYFKHHLRRRLETENSEIPKIEILELVLRD
jgi:hypothetical protein